MALIHLVMNSDPDHIAIVHIFQHTIKQVVYAIYKVRERIR